MSGFDEVVLTSRSLLIWHSSFRFPKRDRSCRSFVIKSAPSDQATMTTIRGSKNSLWARRSHCRLE